MTRHSRRRWIIATTGCVAALSLTACGGTGSPGTGMMGGRSSAGPGMMAGEGMTYRQLTCSPPAALPGEVVRVRLSDMGMTAMGMGDAPMGARMVLQVSPATVPTGTVSVLVENLGWRTHELVVLPLAAGQAAGRRVPGPDGRVDEAGSLGEASASCAAGRGDGIAAGSTGWTTLRLAPCRYELVCNLRHHYADGVPLPQLLNQALIVALDGFGNGIYLVFHFFVLHYASIRTGSCHFTSGGGGNPRSS